MKKKISFSIFPVIFLLLIASCTTKLTNVWKDENYQGAPFKKVFILVALQNPSIKTLFEDEFVSQLGTHRTDSVASYEIVPYYFISDKESIVSSIKETGADVVLIMNLIKTEKEEIYVPEQNFVIPTWYYDWYSYYSRSLKYIQIPKNDDEDYLAIIETNIYNSENEKLIWFVRSEIIRVTCGCLEIKLVVKVIIDKLSSDQLIR